MEKVLCLEENRPPSPILSDKHRWRPVPMIFSLFCLSFLNQRGVSEQIWPSCVTAPGSGLTRLHTSRFRGYILVQLCSTRIHLPLYDTNTTPLAFVGIVRTHKEILWMRFNSYESFESHFLRKLNMAYQVIILIGFKLSFIISKHTGFKKNWLSSNTFIF